MNDHIRQGTGFPRWVWLTCLVLTLLKIWLTAGQAVYAIGTAAHDDQHFVVQASYLLQGQWLGPYDEMTLIKGPFFPAWIAFSFLLGLPLLVSVQILYAFSAWILTIALRPFVSRDACVPFLYGLLLFDPASHDVTRVLRQLISPALTVLVAACALKLLLMQASDVRKLWWAVGFGAAFACLWLTREEGVVLVPFLLLVFGMNLYLAWRSDEKRNVWRSSRLWLISFGVWAAIVYSVAGLNYLHYGVFSKTELDAESFAAAYGALSRVKPAEYKPLVPVAKETRMRIYRVSPAFGELEPFLEGSLGQGWERRGEYMQDAANENEILGAWFLWAFRGAVARAGHYQEGKYPEEYYSRLASEVNVACDRHHLECYRARATLAPVWHDVYLLPFAGAFMEKLNTVLSYRFDRNDWPSTGTVEQLKLFRDLTRSRITEPNQYSIRIQAAASKTPVKFQVKDEKGAPVRFTVKRSASPGFRRSLLERGKDLPGSGMADFLLVAACSGECSLEIWAGGTRKQQLRFDDIEPTIGVIDHDGLAYHVASYDPPPAEDALPRQAGLDRARLTILQRVLEFYRLILPAMTVCAIVVYVASCINVVRRRTGVGLWITLTGFATLVLARVALISFFDVSAFTTPGNAYLLEVYPILLGFDVTACIAGVDQLAGLRTRRSRPAMPPNPR